MELEPGCSCVLSGAGFENDYGPWLGGEMKMCLELGQSRGFISLLPVALYSTLVVWHIPLLCWLTLCLLNKVHVHVHCLHFYSLADEKAAINENHRRDI